MRWRPEGLLSQASRGHDETHRPPSVAWLAATVHSDGSQPAPCALQPTVYGLQVHAGPQLAAGHLDCALRLQASGLRRQA